MRGLDLVVTSDTVTAHLAGALGVPVWVALAYDADWRWLQARAIAPGIPACGCFGSRSQATGRPCLPQWRPNWHNSPLSKPVRVPRQTARNPISARVAARWGTTTDRIPSFAETGLYNLGPFSFCLQANFAAHFGRFRPVCIPGVRLRIIVACRVVRSCSLLDTPEKSTMKLSALRSWFVCRSSVYQSIPGRSFAMMVLAAIFASTVASTAASGQTVFPEADWQVAKPEAQSMSSEGLDKVGAVAQRQRQQDRHGRAARPDRGRVVFRRRQAATASTWSTPPPSRSPARPPAWRSPTASSSSTARSATFFPMPSPPKSARSPCSSC